jgi:N-terminal conserved domain of Nudc./CS domain
MSLPTPNTNTSTTNFDRENERLYIELVQRSHGDLRQLLSSFFSFLHRRTDLYCIMDDSNDDSNINRDENNNTAAANTRSMGFKEGEAEKIIIAAFRQFPLRRIAPSMASHTVSTSAHSKIEEATKLKDPAPTTTKAVTTSTATTVTTAASGTSADVKMHDISDPVQKSSPATQDENSDEIQYTEDGLQIPIGNGGITSKYRWTQTLEECTVLVQCPKSNNATPLRGKDIRVALLPNTLRVQIVQQGNVNDKAGTILLDGELSQRIVPSESTWTIESGVIQIILYKHVKTFWDSIFLNDTIKIDTSLVDSRRNIDTYDEVTQAHIRKIIFEQQQQSMGLPTTLEDTIITSGDGMKPKIPTVLPNGVEYIDQDILDTKMKELGK